MNKKLFLLFGVILLSATVI